MRFLIAIMLSLLLVGCSQSESDPKSAAVVQGEGMGYTFEVDLNQRPYEWGIGYNGETAVVVEDDSNEQHLNNFRNAVWDIEMYVKMLAFPILYLVLIFITSFIVYKKRRHYMKHVVFTASILAFITMYFLISTFVDLSIALKQANDLYHALK